MVKCLLNQVTCSFLQALEEEQADGENVVLSPVPETGLAEEAMSTGKVPETPQVSEKNETELPNLEVSEVSDDVFLLPFL